MRRAGGNCVRGVRALRALRLNGERAQSCWAWRWVGSGRRQSTSLTSRHAKEGCNAGGGVLIGDEARTFTTQMSDAQPCWRRRGLPEKARRPGRYI